MIGVQWMIQQSDPPLQTLSIDHLQLWQLPPWWRLDGRPVTFIPNLALLILTKLHLFFRFVIFGALD